MAGSVQPLNTTTFSGSNVSRPCTPTPPRYMKINFRKQLKIASALRCTSLEWPAWLLQITTLNYSIKQVNSGSVLQIALKLAVPTLKGSITPCEGQICEIKLQNPVQKQPTFPPVQISLFLKKQTKTNTTPPPECTLKTYCRGINSIASWTYGCLLEKRGSAALLGQQKGKITRIKGDGATPQLFLNYLASESVIGQENT